MKVIYTDYDAAPFGWEHVKIADERAAARLDRAIAEHKRRGEEKLIIIDSIPGPVAEAAKILDVRIPTFEEMMADWTSEERDLYARYMMGHASVGELRKVFS